MRTTPISRQLEAYQEGWKVDHQEAMRCRLYEESVAIGISIFRLLKQLDSARRYRVTIGVEPFEAEDDAAMKQLFVTWLATHDLATNSIDHFETTFGALDGADEFRKCCAECKLIVEGWIRPQFSKATGMHAAEFSEAETKKLDELLADGGARLRIKPRPIR